MKVKGKPKTRVGCLRLFLGTVFVVTVTLIVLQLTDRYLTEQAVQQALDTQCPGKNYQVSQGQFTAEFIEAYRSWWVNKGLYCVEHYGRGVNCIC